MASQALGSNEFAACSSEAPSSAKVPVIRSNIDKRPQTITTNRRIEIIDP
jgi:hypothetical protein